MKSTRQNIILQIIAELMRDGKDLKQILAELSLHLRSVMVYQAAGTVEDMDLYSESDKILQEQEKLFAQERLMQMIQRLHEAMNELRVIFEKQRDRLDELEEIDVEAMLDRIEKIAQLKKRYGSIEEVLAHLARRKEELSRYENIGFEKQTLAKEVSLLKAQVDETSFTLSSVRKAHLLLLEASLNSYLKELYMPEVHLSLEEGALNEQGFDILHVNLGKVDLKKNQLRRI